MVSTTRRAANLINIFLYAESRSDPSHSCKLIFSYNTGTSTSAGYFSLIICHRHSFTVTASEYKVGRHYSFPSPQLWWQADPADVFCVDESLRLFRSVRARLRFVHRLAKGRPGARLPHVRVFDQVRLGVRTDATVGRALQKNPGGPGHPELHVLDTGGGKGAKSAQGIGNLGRN